MVPRARGGAARGGGRHPRDGPRAGGGRGGPGRGAHPARGARPAVPPGGRGVRAVPPGFDITAPAAAAHRVRPRGADHRPAPQRGRAGAAGWLEATRSAGRVRRAGLAARGVRVRRTPAALRGGRRNGGSGDRVPPR